MIKELVNVSWSIMVLYEEEERAGRMSREEAQNKAIGEIEHLRYGDEFRDYFLDFRYAAAIDHASLLEGSYRRRPQ